MAPLRQQVRSGCGDYILKFNDHDTKSAFYSGGGYGDYISKLYDHVPKIVFYGWGGHGDYISMITFYSDYSKAEVDAVITAN